MPWRACAFVLLPSAAAVILGLGVRRPASAAWVAAGAAGLFLVVATLGVPLLRPVVPLLTGAAMAALGLAALLALRPAAGRVAQVQAALGAALAAHLTFLPFALVAR